MDQLKQEFDALWRYIQRVRQEVAAIDRPADKDHHFDSTGDQLNAIVAATEEATNTIMECMESNEDAIGKLRKRIPYERTEYRCEAACGRPLTKFKAVQSIDGSGVCFGPNAGRAFVRACKTSCRPPSAPRSTPHGAGTAGCVVEELGTHHTPAAQDRIPHKEKAPQGRRSTSGAAAGYVLSHRSAETISSHSSFSGAVEWGLPARLYQ